MRQEEAALSEAADLRKALTSSFTPEKIGVKDLDEIDPKTMIEILGDAVGSASDAQAKLIMSKVAGAMSNIDKKIEGTQRALVQMMASLTVNEARSKFKDFNDYSEDINKVLKSTQGLSPEDAYILVKAKKTASQPGQKQVESERPSSFMNPSSRRESGYDEESEEIEEVQHNENEIRNPRAAFREAAMKAAENVINARRNAH